MAPDAPVQGPGEAGRRISEAEALERLRGLISYDYRQADLARDLGVSAAFVSSVLLGRKPPSEQMLARVGLARRVEIREIE